MAEINNKISDLYNKLWTPGISQKEKDDILVRIEKSHRKNIDTDKQLSFEDIGF